MSSMLFVMPTPYQNVSIDRAIRRGEDTICDPGRDMLDIYRYVNLIRPSCWGTEKFKEEKFIFTQ